MTKLSKANIEQRDTIIDALREAQDDLETTIDAYNVVLRDQWAYVEEKLTALNDAINNANGWRAEVLSEIGEHIGGRSDKWRESEKGQEYLAWEQAYEEEYACVELEEPEALEIDPEDYAQLISDLPEEP